MTIDLGKSLPWALCLVAVAWGGVQSCRARNAQEAAGKSALRADSVEAAADKSKAVAAAIQRALAKDLVTFGDSLQAVSRRVIQEKQRADDVDGLLRSERIVSARLAARIDSLHRVIVAMTPTVEDSAGVRTGTFHVQQDPYTVDATAKLPRPPAVGSLDLGIKLAPIPLNLRLECGPANAAGIRPATAILSGPSWATPTLGDLSQSEELCKSPALAKHGVSRLKWLGIGAGIVEGARALACAILKVGCLQ